MRRILLDTHIFLWLQFESEKLSDNLLALLKSGDVNWYLSQVSVLEIQIKHSLGKLPLPEAPAEWLPELIGKSGLQFCPISNEAIFMLGKLPNLHRDPFDRLLISTALTEGWEIATIDHRVRQYPIRAVS
ncbi:MAG TPA: type II toxin-antitoxin system VapC family toxin [Oceanipulchritudo sp.]|nr:type II toxin-antitoxin system VapC family toxin [Oceanipulchritudo sp.]